MLELAELKRMHDKAYTHNQITRERAADDMVFYHVTQWDDNLLGESQLAYRGEFNILKKSGRQIIGDLRANPIQVDFEATDTGREEDAELLDGLYRSDAQSNSSLEAFDNANMETVVCGVGGWELFTEYKTRRNGSKEQVIRRRPIYEANNNSYPDPNAKALDKSDADYWSLLVPYTKEGYKDLVKNLTGEEITSVDMASFKTPEESYAFPWAAGENAYIYIARFYHRELVKDKILTLEDPLGQQMLVRESSLKAIMDELIDEGYSIVGNKTIERYQVTLYIASGAEILKTYEIAGENIPVIPQYGDRAFVEGEEHYEGVTRLTKDPQRLRNFQMSYLADIVSRSPRPKPIFLAAQLGQYQMMYEDNGADNNFPYYLQEQFDAQGRELPIGPVAQMPEQKVPTALVQSIALSREAVGDVAPANVPQDIADVDLSGKAVAQLQARLDEQSIVYQQNRKFSLRRDAEIYASMASEIVDSPREVTVTKPDGTRTKVNVMDAVVDKQTGELVVLNDLTNMEFDVFADIGPSYKTQKEQTLEQLGAMAQQVVTADPNMHRMIILQQLSMMEGVNTDNIRDYANKQMILGGFKEPETDDELQLLQQAQQSQEPDANMVLAMAEDKKGQAALAKEETARLRLVSDSRDDQQKNQISAFEAQTDRMNTQIDAKEAGATIDYKRTQALGQRIDNIAKTAEYRTRLTGVVR